MSRTTLRFIFFDNSRYPSSTVVTQESFEKVQQALQGEQAMQEYKRRIEAARARRKEKQNNADGARSVSNDLCSACTTQCYY